jgi:GT2 family glycosyltransferase
MTLGASLDEWAPGIWPKVGIVVVHWRGMENTRECLRSLSALTYPDVEILVVVNGTEDFDEEAARTVCPSVRVVRSASNGGYAAACNIGARDVFASGARYTLLLNNDTVVAPGLIEPLVTAFSIGNVGVCGPVVTYDDASVRVWSAGGYVNTLLGYTRHVGFNDPSPPGCSQTVDFVSGCAILVGRQMWEQLDGMDEHYFHYFEDVDLCARARAIGKVSHVVAEPLVRHKVSASAGAPGSNRLNRTQAYYFTRNRWRFVTRNVAGLRRYCALLSQLVLLLPYEALRDIGQRNFGALTGRCAGLGGAIRGQTGPIRARRSDATP